VCCQARHVALCAVLEAPRSADRRHGRAARPTRLITLLVKRTATGCASGVSSQMTEKASRSPPARNEQMSSVSGLGSMSMRRCTR